jgi:hypothetical protein
MVLNNLAHGELRIDVVDKQGVVLMTWSGASDSPEPSNILFPFLERLADQSLGKALTVDLRSLQFMNSATVAPMLKFVRHLERLAVKTRLIYASEAQWQRIHYNVMKAVVSSLAHVSVELS